MNCNGLDDFENDALFSENDFDLEKELGASKTAVLECSGSQAKLARGASMPLPKPRAPPPQQCSRMPQSQVKQPNMQICSDDLLDDIWSSDANEVHEPISKCNKIVFQPKVSDSDLEDLLCSSPQSKLQDNATAKEVTSMPSSSPPDAGQLQSPAKVQLSSQELDALVDDPEWGFDVAEAPIQQINAPKNTSVPVPASPLKLSTNAQPTASPDFVGIDFDSSFGDSIFTKSKSQEIAKPDIHATPSRSPTDLLPSKSQENSKHQPESSAQPRSSYAWSTSPDWHKTETLFSRNQKLIQNKLAVDSSGIKRKASSSTLAPNKSPHSSTNNTPSPKLAQAHSKTTVIPSSSDDLFTPSPPDMSVEYSSIEDAPKAKSLETASPLLPTKKSSVLNAKFVSPFVADEKPRTRSSRRAVSESRVAQKSSALGPAKSSRKGQQTRLTTLISPMVKKAHQSTLVEDIQAQKMAEQNNGAVAPIFLTDEQRRILSMIVDEGRTVFFTGAAGTGKSVLLRRVISELRQKHKNKSKSLVSVTASTGLAACNIGGMTLHSFAGIGLGEEPVDRLVEKVRQNKRANRRWKETKVLVIDEISMIDGALFDKLEHISRVINKNEAPFGGIQLVITGDFFQLPPVFKPINVPSEFDSAAGGFEMKKSLVDDMDTESQFSFEAESWKSVVTTTVELKQVFRQKDNTFSNMLNAIRAGTVTDEIEEAFRSLSREPTVPGDITPTELFPLRRDVDNANRIHMNRLQGPQVTFQAVDSLTNKFAQKKLDLLMCPPELRLKKGAQVMLIKNMDESLVNGSLGKIIGFMSESSYKLMQNLPSEKSDRIINGQISAQEAAEEFFDELKNERKSKSKKDPHLDDNDIDQLMELENNRLQDNPQKYRVQYLDEGEKVIETIPQKKLQLSLEENQRDDAFGLADIPEEIVEKDPENVNWKRKRELMKLMNKASKGSAQAWPYVRFLLQDGTTRDVLIQPETWKIEDHEGRTEASRSQVPLILAWALSIHKSQGQTLEWVKVDLTRIFEKGQSYVALSRAVRMDGLQVLGFERSKIMVHPKVIDFYAGLSSALDTNPEELEESSENDFEDDSQPVNYLRRRQQRNYLESSG